MKKYIIILFAGITLSISSCATRARSYAYDYEYNNPGQGSYYYGENRHRSHWWNRNRDNRYGRDYRYGDGDYDDYSGTYDQRNYGHNYQDDYGSYNNRHRRHHHHRGIVIVF